MEQEIKENVLTLDGGADGKAQTLSGGKGTEDPTELPAKFKDVDALLQAYNSLQAEFTRRSQRLKELETAALKNTPAPTATPAVTEGEDASSTVEPASAEQSLQAEPTEEMRKRIIQEYLSDVKKSAIPLARGGVAVATPADNPKSIAEAGKMALGYLKRG